MKRLLISLGITLAGMAAAHAARPKGPPAATPAGPAVRCVPIASIRETQVRDDSTIDFMMRDGSVYRNALPNSCPELGFERSFSYETSLSQLCNVDLITVFRAGSAIRRGATCGLGDFQPVTLAK